MSLLSRWLTILIRKFNSNCRISGNHINVRSRKFATAREVLATSSDVVRSREIMIVHLHKQVHITAAVRAEIQAATGTNVKQHLALAR